MLHFFAAPSAPWSIFVRYISHAWPVAYFIMNKRLGSFGYRTEIGAGVFLVSGGLGLVIALLSEISNRRKRPQPTRPTPCGVSDNFFPFLPLPCFLNFREGFDE
jgi:hypothetical protein